MAFISLGPKTCCPDQCARARLSAVATPMQVTSQRTKSRSIKKGGNDGDHFQNRHRFGVDVYALRAVVNLERVVGGHLGNDVCGRDRDSYLRRARKSLGSHQRSAGRPHRRKRPTGGHSGGSTAIWIHASRKSESVGI